MNINLSFAVEGMTADQARAASLPAKVKREIEQAEQKLRFQKEVETAIPYLVQQALDTVPSSCKMGWEWATYYIYKNTIPVSVEAIHEAIPHAITLLQGMGYAVSNLYEYSRGWQYQSGKIGYLTLNWTKK